MPTRGIQSLELRIARNKGPVNMKKKRCRYSLGVMPKLLNSFWTNLVSAIP